jgi:hypothetical protein
MTITTDIVAVIPLSMAGRPFRKKIASDFGEERIALALESCGYEESPIRILWIVFLHPYRKTGDIFSRTFPRKIALGAFGTGEPAL